MTSKHSFPVIGLWDGKPFGYFEIYWVKEDVLGKLLGDRAGDFDRGVHVLIGEEEFRGKHRVKVWITALAHWAFVQDYRTGCMVLEPRVDNERYAPVSSSCDGPNLMKVYLDIERYRVSERSRNYLSAQTKCIRKVEKREF
jgi:hypothetical protein